VVASSGAARLRPQVETACPVCGGVRHRLLVSAADLEADRQRLVRFHRSRLRTPEKSALEERADFTQDYPTDVVGCDGCGLVLRDPRPTDEAVARAYAADRYGTERLEALFVSQLELYRRKARTLARFLTTGRPVVLEIGSFVGGFLAAAAERGWDAHGIDPGREVSAFAASRGLSVLTESVEQLGFPAAAADCVAVWNTFDQLPDPHPTLESARRCLRRDGVLVLRVPGGEAFELCMRLRRRMPPIVASAVFTAMAWNNLVTFPYLHGYSLATLDRLVAAYGFRRIHARGDVLVRLADEQTKSWAAVEERIVKTAWKLAAAVSPRGVAIAPWIDVYYRAGPAS